jgi:cytochrome P450
MSTANRPFLVVIARTVRDFARHRLVRASLRRKEKRHGLVPLPIVRVDAEAAADQRFLLRQAQFGPFFRSWGDGGLTTHIFGIEAGRRFLTSNEAHISVVTARRSRLFPHGTLREMEGAPHHKYRRQFAEAFRSVRIADNASIVNEICRAAATELREAGQINVPALNQILKRPAVDVMVRLTLGLDSSDARHRELVAICDGLPPARVVSPADKARYVRMHAIVASALVPDASSSPTLLSELQRAGHLDATAVGNLARIIEAGSYDMLGLWVWLMKMCGDNPDILPAIAAAEPAAATALSEAAVFEALRLERSEYLQRRVHADLVFDGVLIPRNTRVRIAVWEAHKDPSRFPDPFRFDPNRFLGKRPSPDDYAPLGLDKHRCLGADWVIGIGSALLRALAQTGEFSIVADGAAERQAFHFAPSPKLVIRFQARATARPSA